MIRSDVRGFPPPCPPTSSQKYSIAPLHSAESSHPNTRADSRIYEKYAKTGMRKGRIRSAERVEAHSASSLRYLLSAMASPRAESWRKVRRVDSGIVFLREENDYGPGEYIIDPIKIEAPAKKVPLLNCRVFGRTMAHTGCAANRSPCRSEPDSESEVQYRVAMSHSGHGESDKMEL